MNNQQLKNENPQVTYREQSAKPLSPLQSLFIDAYWKHEGSLARVAETIQRSIQQCCAMMKSSRVQLELARGNHRKAVEMVQRPDFVVTKAERIEILWQIAKEGASKIYDKEGNEVMMAPATSVSAVRTINDMVEGSLAPKQSEITVKVEDNRTEAEVRASIAKLTAEYNALAVIDGVTDDDIDEVMSLPSTNVEARDMAKYDEAKAKG